MREKEIENWYFDDDRKKSEHRVRDDLTFLTPSQMIQKNITTPSYAQDKLQQKRKSVLWLRKRRQDVI
jgi:hypothetical protein